MNTLYNVNMERSVLSSILNNPALFEDIASEINSNVFYLPEHKNIFEAMDFLEKNDKPIDQEFLVKKLSQDNNFSEQAMIDLLATSPLPNVNAYVDELKDKYFKRSFVKLSSDINRAAIDNDLSSKEIQNIIEQKIFEISQKDNQKEIYDGKKLAQEALEELKQGKQESIGISTSYRDLDKKILGFGKGNLIIIAARPSMGKSALALNIIEKALERKSGAVFFSLEMPANELTNRLISSKTSIPLQKIRTKELSDDDKKRYKDAAKDISQYSFFVDEDKNINIHSIRSKLRKLKAQNPNIELCVIDYLQLMQTSSKKDRYLEVGDISRGLKLLAGELNIPIVALSQLNRTLESRHDKRPMLSDLRESGALEQDSDIVLFVYRDAVYKQKEERERAEKARSLGKEYVKSFSNDEEEKAEIIIGKNRNGPIGTVNLIFQKNCVRFVNNFEVVEIIYGDE